MAEEDFIQAALEENSGKYGWLEYFFLVSEFVFGTATVEEKMLSKTIGSGKPNFAQSMRFWEPVCTTFSLYAADSFLGKLFALVIFTGGIGVAQGAVLVFAATGGSLGNASGDTFSLVMTFLTDVHRPLRWALMYASKPNKPFKEMRRFIVLLEAAYLFGKFAMKLVKTIPGVAKANYLDIVLPVVLIVNYLVYTVLLVLTYKKQALPTYFERFAVDKSIQDIVCMVAKKVGTKSQALQHRLQNCPRNKALSVGLLITIAVFLPFTTARLDNEIIKKFIKNNKEFVTGGKLKLGMDTVAPFISGMVLIGTEYGLTPLLQRFGHHPYYICWLTVSYIGILTSMTMMTYLYIQLEIEMPFPKLPPGKAHLTVFNCLPASLEVEWPSDGEIDRIRNLDYTRKILINVNKEAVKKVVLQNKPAGMYWPANITLIEGRENVYVVNHDGINRANMSEALAFDRYENTKAQVRILDCFEVCCHGSVTFTPKKLHKKYKHKQKSVTVKLTRNLLSKRIDIYEGSYDVSYQPDDSTTLQLGTIHLDILDKVVVLLNSLQHPTYKVENMVALSSSNVGIYVATAIIDSIFRISHAYQKMIVVYLTDRKIFSFMLGIHFMLTRTAEFLSILFFYNKDLNHDHYFAMLGLSGFCFIAYSFTVIKFKSHFNPTFKHDEDAPKLVSQRPRASSNETYESVDPNKKKAL